MCVSFYVAANNNKDALQKLNGVSNQQCTDCHQQQQQSWQKSDHSKSMAVADNKSVLANFDNVDVKHYGQKAHFFIKDKQYQVTISYGDKTDTYPIKYTFGYFPLQQYLVETEQGKLQVLPFAWDSRDKAQGGQRWYHNYQHEDIRPEDRLHWRQPLQNWNGMCADCHSDGLVRNYNSEQNTFNSQFDNINVGCLSCHGNMSEHINQSTKRKVGIDVTSVEHPTGQWLRSLGEKTAHWQGDKRDNTFMDNCFACHSLRSPLTDGFKANTPFLEQFSPTLLAAPMYHADGQIKEEVYVYGSFLQSKMFKAGVNCLDCHDKHTMKLKVEDNGLCLQCHGSDVYNVKSHHQHQEESTGAQCVNCHMPTNRYMGVDDRRDHSFKIPRPDLSSTFNTPNACIGCHKDKPNEWAKTNLEKWHGKPKSLSQSKHLLMRLNTGQLLSLPDHLTIIADDKLDVISRATAIQLLSFTTSSLNANVLTPYLIHPEPLIRLSAVKVAVLLTPEDKVKYLSPLLKDEFKSIRIAAAQNLVANNVSIDIFNKEFKELITAYEINSWRGEGRANQGSLALEMRELTHSEQSFKQAVDIDPYFEGGYINLADIYRAQQRAFQVATVLLKGIQNIPKSANLHYAYGLHLIRQKDKTKAIVSFKKAMDLALDNPQFAYTYILALDGNKQSRQALSQLKELTNNYQNKTQLIELGLYLSRKLRSPEDYKWFINL